GNKDGVISKAEFEADPRKNRALGIGDTTFAQLDANGNETLEAADLRQLRKATLDAIDAKEIPPIEAYLKVTAAVSLPNGWLADHFAHPPMWTFLSKLTVPVGIFHAEGDANTPVDGTRRLEEQAKKEGKTNLKFFY